MADGQTAHLLMCAVHEGNEEQLRTLIAFEGFSETADGGYTLLLEAIRCRNYAIARFLMSSGAKVNLERKQQHYDPDNTPLHIAIRNREMDIADMLLSRGADIYASGDYGTTQIREATRTGTLEFLELLFNRGVDLNAKAPFGMRPLHIAAMEGNEDAVILLLSYGADIDASSKNNKTALCFAAEKTHVEVVKLLLEFEPDVNNEGNKLALYGVVQANVSSILLDAGNSICHKYPTLPFYNAYQVEEWREISERKQKIFATLLEYGFYYELEPGCDAQFFHGAIELGFLEIVEDLLTYGADANMDYFRETSLLVAIKTNQPDITELLIFYGADVNTQDGKRKPPICYAAESGNAKLFNILLTHGATVRDYPDVVHAAISGKSPEIVEQLLSLGKVHINDCTYEGTPALIASLQRSCADVTALLLEKGANVNARCEEYEITPLHVASANGDHGICETMLKKGAAINAKNKNGRTPLHCAVNAEIVKTLIHSGADINARDLMGQTPLHTAVKEKREIVVDALLKFDPDVDLIDKNCKTALHLACRTLQAPTVRLLLNYGADINICENDLFTLFCLQNFHRRETDVIIQELFLHIDKMQMINLYVSDANLVVKWEAEEDLPFLSENVLTKQRQHWIEEIGKLQATEINNSNVTYYEFLTKNSSSLAVLLGNENILQTFQPGNPNTEVFPNYAPLLKLQFRKAMERKGLVEQCHEVFGFLCHELPPLPTCCIEEVFQYFSNKDLQTFLAVGGPPCQLTDTQGLLRQF